MDSGPSVGTANRRVRGDVYLIRRWFGPDQPGGGCWRLCWRCWLRPACWCRRPGRWNGAATEAMEAGAGRGWAMPSGCGRARTSRSERTDLRKARDRVARRAKRTGSGRRGAATAMRMGTDGPAGNGPGPRRGWCGERGADGRWPETKGGRRLGRARRVDAGPGPDRDCRAWWCCGF